MERNDKEFEALLEQRKKIIEGIIEQTEMENSSIQGVDGLKVHVLRKENSFQYYLRNSPTDFSGKYVKKDNLTCVKKILQKDYNSALIKEAKTELKILDKYLSKVPPTNLNKIYENLSIGRRRMITPLTLPDEEYIKEWEAEEYEGKAFPDDYPEFFTFKGERVRSKSEIIIANTLYRHGIPYKYERPLKVKGMGTVYPDFTALNIRKRKEIYIEHLGMLDDETYCNNALGKIAKYEMDNITLGDNLLITYETQQLPLNISLLEKKICKMLE